jgi:hypothetical protein
VKPLVAEDADAVGVRERHDDKIADLHGADLVAHGLDDADGLVAHPATSLAVFQCPYGQRSLPQMQARVTRTSASVDSIRRAVGTFSIRTSLAPCMTAARTLGPPFVCRGQEVVVSFGMSKKAPDRGE